MRLIFVLLTLLFLISHATAAPIGGGGSGLGYSCSNDAGKPATCTCSGYFDCKKMTDANVCKEPIFVCGKTDGIETCYCNWKVSRTVPGGKISPNVMAPNVLISP